MSSENKLSPEIERAIKAMLKDDEERQLATLQEDIIKILQEDETKQLAAATAIAEKKENDEIYERLLINAAELQNIAPDTSIKN